MAMHRSCLYCAERFEVRNSRRVFCSDTCRVRYNREHKDRCFYCGELADTRDHLTPQAVGSAGLSQWLGQDVVQCCRECNMLLGDRYAYALIPRMEHLAHALVRKYKLADAVPEWDDSEVEELGPSLRSYVRGRVRARQRALDRVWHVRAVISVIRRYEE
jgi:hypothetical protein